MARRPLLLALGVAAILVVGIAACLRMGDGRVSGGPLEPPPGFKGSTEFTVHLDRPYSWGLVFLTNKGDEDAVVTRVEPLDLRGAMTIVGVYATSSEGPSIGFEPGWDSSLGRPAEGLVVPPGKSNGYQLVFGVQADGQGISSVRAVRVEYRVGDTEYETTFEQAVVLCAPIEQYDTCPGEPKTQT
jgi:hypothetical protein